jgi:ureidoglycolate lyase
MEKVAFKKLNLKDFCIYGSFANLIDLQNEGAIKIGTEPIEFFRDLMLLNLGQNSIASFSICRIVKRPPVIDCSEFHSYCGEAMLPLDGDILMHVGPATPDREVPLDKIEVFHVPKGTIISMRPGVWHHAPFTYKCNSVNILVVLPERTYANDCTLIEIPKGKQIEIEEI